MRYVAAYLLAVLGGNEAPTANDVRQILGSVGIEADNERLNMVIKELKGKNIDELMEEGSKRLAQPLGAGGPAVSAASAAVTSVGEAPVEADKKKEEAADDGGESSDDDMGFGLFDD